MKFEMKCTCGEVFSVEAETKDQAVSKVKEEMTPEVVKSHFAEKHHGQSAPPMPVIHMLVAQAVRPAASD